VSARTKNLLMPDELTVSDEPFAAASSVDAIKHSPRIEEPAFRALYEKAARPVWAYLRRVSGDPSVADDLLQEAWIRLLQAPIGDMEEAHQKNYLFRIATNLLRDRFRAAKHGFVPLPELASGERLGHHVALQTDMRQFLLHLKPRERDLLWLAYVEGYEHQEIAAILRCRTISIRPMLFRARQRLAELLRAGGWRKKPEGEEQP
jgi:RNA polymerase sigma-70 factor, ECF subfamily